MAKFLSLASRTGLLAAIFAIVTLAVGGGWAVYRHVVAVEAELPDLEAGRLRDSFVAFGDLHRVTLALSQRTDRTELSRALDYLFVRKETLARAFLSRSGSTTPPAETRGLLTALEAIFPLGDAYLAARPANERGARIKLHRAIEDANAALILFVNAQQQAHGQAIQTQSRSLMQMTVSSFALLIVFTFISIAAVTLLRSEILERLSRRAAEQKAAFLAYHDPMTGMPNRIRFTELAQAALEEDAKRSDDLVTVLTLIDLDEFKLVNDTHGHAVGDALLVAFAERVRTALERFGAHAARIGGDEFAAIARLPRGADARESFCRDILDAIRAPLTLDGVALAPRASLGVACVTQTEETVGTLLKQADIALYEAKRLGRDGFVIYGPALDAKARRRRDLMRELAEAIGSGAMYLAFQPQVRLTDGGVYGFEALTRWRRDGVDIPPSEFIALAEETGLVVDLDLWALREATRQAALWRRSLGVDINISVNLSALHFRSDAIIEAVERALFETGLPPHLLTLEITETTVLRDWPMLSKVIDTLHAQGVRIAIDDFGVGYSSLNYLRRIKADQVKIDRAFVLDLDTSHDARAILRALVDLSQDLHMDLLVEGVETLAQRNMLLQIGCGSAQGYLFGRPLSAQAARELLTHPAHAA